jgi:hypothetical protein
MNLTKEYLDKALKGLATKDDLEKQTRILTAHNEDQIENLAAMVADGFEEVKELLDVRERMKQLEKDMRKIKEALNV